MTIDELYRNLRNLINGNFIISIHDGQRHLNCCEVSVHSRNDDYFWTRFEGSTIEDALQRAIDKFQNPEKDYVELSGHVWKSNDESCFSAEHIRRFLKKAGREVDAK